MILNVIQISILFATNIVKRKGWSVKEVIYGCIRGLDGGKTDCKLGMHDKCFGEIQKSMIHDIGSRHNSGSNWLEMLKSCCHHSLRHLCVHTYGAWWKMKKYCCQKDIGNYPDRCIIRLKFFSNWCISAVNKSTQIMTMEEYEKEEERIE